MDADAYAIFSTVCGCKVTCFHQGVGDIRRHVVSKKHTAYATSMQSQERIHRGKPILNKKSSKITKIEMQI